MKYEIRSYTGSLKCKVDGHVAASIFKAVDGHFKTSMKYTPNEVYVIDKDVEFKISPVFVLCLWKNDIISKI